MALGSQKWNGTCADLVKAATSDEAEDPGIGGADAAARPRARERRDVPGAGDDVQQDAAGQQRQPADAGDDQRLHRGAAGGGRSWSKPISRNEVTAVSSQKAKSATRLSASTSPSIAPMKSSMKREEAAAMRMAAQIGAGIDEDRPRRCR